MNRSHASAVRANNLAIFAELSREDAPYFAALGRLVSDYAFAEAVVHILARHLSGIGDAKARAIFGGMRLGDLIDRVRRMMRLNNVPAAAYENIDACLTQLNLVGDRRGELVHRLVEYAGGRLHATNTLTAKSLESVERRAFTISDLRDMQTDCGVIYIRLIAFIAPDAAHARQDQIRPILQAPWRYKSFPPRTQKKARGAKAHGAPQPPPDASSV